MNSVNPKVPVVSPQSTANIEAIALDLLKRYSPDSLKTPSAIPALELFDSVLPVAYGFKTGVQKLSKGLEGFTDILDKSVFLAEKVYSKLEKDDGRARFSAMHEIGHVILHGNQSNLAQSYSGGMVLARKSDIPAYLDPEWQANQFASAILLPTPMVHQLVRECRLRGDYLVLKTAETFKVSKQASQIKLKKLGYIQ